MRYASGGRRRTGVAVSALAAALGFFAVSGVASAAAPTVLSAKVTGPSTVAVIFSEPVRSAASDYSNFTGGLSGRTVTSLSGSNTAGITLFLSGGNLPANATGGFSLATTTVSASDNSPFGNGVVTVTDGQPPSLTMFSVLSNNADNTFLGNGNSLTITFSANEALLGPSVTVAGHSVGAVGGGGSGPFTASYVLTSADTAGGSVPVGFTLPDMAGNVGTATVTLGGGAAGSGTANGGSVVSTAGTAGVLKDGDSITFTLTPPAPVPNGSVTGSYNSTPLSWTTNNGGATYTATYTVSPGQNDQASPLEISGVTLVNAGGTAVGTFSGSDVAKTISANPPILTEVMPVPSSTNATPVYGFTSSKMGTLSYGGDCGSPIGVAGAGLNTVVLNSLAPGLHSNCTITVTDSAGNTSNTLALSAFTILPPSGSAAEGAAGSPGGTPGRPYLFTAPLLLGSRGDGVRELQRRLTDEGVYGAGVTGYFGPLTEAGVKAFQKKYGLAPLGNVGPGTRAALNAGE